MFLLLVIPILISGFYVCNHNLYYYYRLHRYEGQYLYLKSALLGTVCLIISSFSAFLINALVPATIFGISIDFIAYLEWLIQSTLTLNNGNLRILSWLIVLCILTLFTAWLWVKISFFHIILRENDAEKSKIILMSSILRDSPLDSLLLDSYIYETPLMLTLNDRKIYVGIVSSLGEPNEREGMDQEIALIPIMSGYRSKENFHVIFNTDYEIINENLNLIIKQEIINSATKFDFDIYKKFLTRRKPQKEIKYKTITIPENSAFFFWKS